VQYLRGARIVKLSQELKSINFRLQLVLATNQLLNLSLVCKLKVLPEVATMNGVNKTLSVEEGTFTSIGFGVHVEDTIQNGVKHTSEWESESKTQVEDALQNSQLY